MNNQDAIEMLKSMLPEKISYAELVGAVGCYGGGEYVYSDPEPYAIETAISALEKQIPKKPIEEEKQYSEDYGFNSDILCPVCNNYIGYYTEAMCKPEYMQYCNECGQRIDDDWSGDDE